MTESRVAYGVVPPRRDGWIGLIGVDGLALEPVDQDGFMLALECDRDWARAFELWLAGKAKNTQRAYRRAWQDLLAFSGKQPWEMLSGDLQAWAEDLARRQMDSAAVRARQRKGLRAPAGCTGLSASTVALWLSAVSSFYRYVTTAFLVPSPAGGERPLHGHNPALIVRRPDVRGYARAEYLDSWELARLLAAVPRTTVAGLRDYALLLGYVLTGRRNAEWRTLRWGDLRARSDRVEYVWSGKGTNEARVELPPPVWEALLEFMEGSGRLERIQRDEYVFRALGRQAARLPCVQRCRRPEGEPLSAESVNRLLRKYARKAGLDAGKLHVHVLRHSAAMLEEQAGSGLAEISRFLGHADPKTTMRYLDHLRGHADGTWKRKAEALGIGNGDAGKRGRKGVGGALTPTLARQKREQKGASDERRGGERARDEDAGVGRGEITQPE